LSTDDAPHAVAGHVAVVCAEVSLMPLTAPRPVIDSLTAYLACGNADALPTREVVITGWRPGAMPISAIAAIRDHSRYGLGTAKLLIEECLAGRRARIEARDYTAAQHLVTALETLGFRAEVCWDG
jgi:hypothetical protein